MMPAEEMLPPLPQNPFSETLALHTEALLFAAERPLSAADIAGYLQVAFATQNPESLPDETVVNEAIQSIIHKYDAPHFAFALRQSGGGYRFLTKETYHATILQLNGDKHIKKLSTAAMETLSIIAYRGPVTKGEIEFIRGVSADYAIQKLLEKELIFISGRKEEAVGKPLLYMPSRHLLDYLGINSANDLPQLKDLGTIEYTEPTPAQEALPNDLLPDNDALN